MPAVLAPTAPQYAEGRRRGARAQVWTARSLYKPSQQKLSPAQTVQLTRTMLLALRMARDKPEMKPEIDRVQMRVLE